MTLKLVKGRSYYGAVFATAEKPIVVVDDEDKAQALIATGYFKVADDIEDGSAILPPDETGGKPAEERVSAILEEMSKPELETAATYHNVDIKGLTKKTDIIAAIKAALPEVAETGTIEYGSPTIVDLQTE